MDVATGMLRGNKGNLVVGVYYRLP